ncbi:hypothetical protein GCM10008171_34920 [Methylopila jiangsuensis]|uniref:Uncharacterized protein n=1 Tax=Methylopila jiangsuensis TaxID=586230 RepID=A0A9W6N5D1_9HYPH|nr:hypothetical protein [Methylopila jiangsuensis]MDR6284377.1 biotin carboxyl carrier protein [Methylopila jiangsuensis]GLK78238.1 hypothetical protein GCM10008171_34920 [Methylopila jiangsuensis]
MADYYPVLSRAVAGLPEKTGENRRAVYERARAAIIRQLRSIDPPLSEEDISRERMQLEDAIRRIEDEQQPAAPEPAAAPPAPRRPAEPPRRAPAPEPQPAQDEARAAAAERAAPPRRGPETRADGRPIIRAAGAKDDRPAGSKRKPLVAIAALALIAAALVGVAGREQIAGLFGGGATETAAVDVPKEPSTPEPATTNGQTKSDDRLLSDDAPAATEPPPADQPAQTDVARAPEPSAAVPPEAQPQTAPQSAAPSQPAAGALVAQRAILYEEGSDQKSGDQVDGTVVWRTESVSAGQGQPLELALRGDAEVPARGIRASIVIRRNVDSTLPASHTVEIQFKLPENFANAGVANVPGILMKTDEAARGAPVQGLSVRVTSGFFLIGLSSIDNERVINEQLLRDRGWIDIPILYDNGRRAVLTLEKGTPGAQAFADAFAAWQNASAGAPPPQP